jgi:hypothetical protein
MDAVNRMWKLCKSRMDREVRPDDTFTSSTKRSSFRQAAMRREPACGGCLP